MKTKPQQLPQKKGDIVLKILKGIYTGRTAIAWRHKQEDAFITRGKICVSVYEDDRKTSLADNVLIDINYCKQIGFAD